MYRLATKRTGKIESTQTTSRALVYRPTVENLGRSTSRTLLLTLE